MPVPDRPCVSVVLCTYSPEMFDHFLEAAESVLSQTYDRVELVVVVDGPEVVADRVLDEFAGRDDVRIVSNDHNVGLLRSRNAGVEAAEGDIVAFIDDDAVADSRWIERLVPAYLDDGAEAAGGRMVAKWVAGRPAFLPEEFYWLIGVTHDGFPDEPTEVRNTFGSNLSFRRDVFDDLGGFDPAIGGRRGNQHLQGGETELCARLQATYGRGVHYRPDAVVAHKVFAYRTRVRWLVSRAFWQGYSKRAMDRLVSEATAEEAAFLRRVLFRSMPHRLAACIRRPSTDAIMQIVMLVMLTGTVGAGYLYGVIRFR